MSKPWNYKTYEKGIKQIESNFQLIALIKWAKGKCYFEVFDDGIASAELKRNDYEHVYEGRNLKSALTKAKRAYDKFKEKNNG